MDLSLTTKKSLFETTIKTTNEMTLEEFTAEFEALQDEGRDKEATILATVEEELYARYWVEVQGEELE